MERYDYKSAILDDVREYIEENINFADFEDLDELREKLNDDLWTEDSVTGNGSGSYTFSTYKAEEYICHNLDLLGEAVEEFGGNCDVLKNGAEACDVTIRCYLLPWAIDEALDEIEDDFKEAHENRDEEE